MEFKFDKNLDKIYLLSIEEYEKYRKNIPLIRCWWWLRSPGIYFDSVVGIYEDGSICEDGHEVSYGEDAVRPALLLDTTGLTIGQYVVRYNFPWIVIGDGIAISDVPIAFHRFDKEGNDYENSEIRKFLLDWLEERK